MNMVDDIDEESHDELQEAMNNYDDEMDRKWMQADISAWKHMLVDIAVRALDNYEKKQTTSPEMRLFIQKVHDLILYKSWEEIREIKDASTKKLILDALEIYKTDYNHELRSNTAISGTLNSMISNMKHI
jgi:hypothetical protein